MDHRNTQSLSQTSHVTLNKPLHFSSVSVGIMAGNRRQSPMGFWGKLNTRTIYRGMNNKKMASTQGLAISGSHFWPWLEKAKEVRVTRAWWGPEAGGRSHLTGATLRGQRHTARLPGEAEAVRWEADTPWLLCLPVFLGLCRKPEGKGAWVLQSTEASFQRHKAGQQGRESWGRARGNRTSQPQLKQT